LGQIFPGEVKETEIPNSTAIGNFFAVACGKPCLICGKLWIGCGNLCGMFGENLAEKIRITNFIFRLISLYLYMIGNQELVNLR
jgi:hypothetical protein